MDVLVSLLHSIMHRAGASQDCMEAGRHMVSDQLRHDFHSAPKASGGRTLVNLLDLNSNFEQH
jgi:hypothetical protein